MSSRKRGLHSSAGIGLSQMMASFERSVPQYPEKRM
jgi:hypothetical protein